MKTCLYFFLLFYLFNLLKWQFVEGMERHGVDRKGKAVMGSSSRSQQIATDVAIQNPEEAIMEFSLPELTFLIKILQSIKEENLLISEDIFIKIVNNYSNKIGFNLENQPLTKQKIKMVIEFYKQKTFEAFDNLGIEYTTRYYYFKSSLYVHLLVFARKLIRSFFDFHGGNKYYDNHVTKKGNKVSHRNYLDAYDRFEVYAVNLLIEMRDRINIFPKSLEELEKDEENIYPAKIVELKYWSLSNETLMNFIYQYEVTNEGLTSQECESIKEKMTNKSSGFSYKFYLYFKTFDENVQLKLEQYIINPFLTEIGYEGRRDDMFTKYLPMDENTLWRYNEYLPQPRNQLSYEIREVCWMIIEGQMYHGTEYRSDKSPSGLEGSGDYLGGSHGASHGSHSGGGHHQGQGHEDGYGGYEHYPEFQGKYGGNPGNY